MTKNSRILSIDSVSKSFGRQAALREVSLDILEGEFFALLGASGSGKTTLLRILAGFDFPDKGRVLLDGIDITEVPPNRRPLNLMFQSYALFPHMTAEANIAYGLEVQGMPKSEVRSRVDEMLSITQLERHAKQRPRQLSGGQQQRVALARALVKRPRVLLLDEPLGALDRKLRSHMQFELKRLQNEVGITFVVVTHDQEESLVMADRIAVLKQGMLQQCDTPRSIYERPASRFVADFIGDSNFIGGTATDSGIVTRDGTMLFGTHACPIDPGTPAIAAVRPERMGLSNVHDFENRLTGAVEAVSYHGTDLQLRITVPPCDHPLLVRVSSDRADQLEAVPGRPVFIGWHARDTRIFDDFN